MNNSAHLPGRYDDPELLDRLAAAYVMGSMGRLPRRRFERLVRSRASAAQALTKWEHHGAALAAVVPPVQPSAAVWHGIERRTGLAASAPRRWVGWLRPTLGFACGLLLTVGVVRLQPDWIVPADLPPQAVLPASYVGLLTDGAGRPAALASSRRRGADLSVKLLQPLAVPAGQVAVLWALHKDRPPFRLGALQAAPKQMLKMPDTSEALLSEVDELGVSFEPSADAARPSSAFVLRGHCVKLW